MKPGGGGSLSVLRDKRVQLAAAAAGLLGLVVFMRRGGGGGVSGDTLAPAGFDSSGSDLAGAVQSAQDGWSNDLRAFSDQLRELNELLAQRPETGTGAAPTPPIRRATHERPAVVPAGRRARAAKGSPWTPWKPTKPTRPTPGGQLPVSQQPRPGLRLPAFPRR